MARWLSHVATAMGMLVALVGIVYLANWLNGHLAQQGLSSITPKTNTALALLLLGIALVLLIPVEVTAARRWAGRGMAALAALIGLLSLSENLLGWDFGIDQLLANEPAGALAVAAPNLMGPPASTGFLLTGLALLILSRRYGLGIKAAQGLALAACLIALLGTIGYLYGAQSLYSIARMTGYCLAYGIGAVDAGFGPAACQTHRRLYGAGDGR